MDRGARYWTVWTVSMALMLGACWGAWVVGAPIARGWIRAAPSHLAPQKAAGSLSIDSPRAQEAAPAKGPAR